MKIIKLLLPVLVLVGFNVMALDKVLCNFDDVKPVGYGSFMGAVNEVIDNPFQDDDNNTASCGQYYGEDYDNGVKTDRFWFASVAIPIDELTIPTTGTYYVHVLVNCYTKPDVAVTFENIQAKAVNRPLVAYDSENGDMWQDLVFKLPAEYAGMTVDTLNFSGDMKWESGGDYVTDMFTHVYYDEIIINENSFSRFSDVVVPETLEMTVSTLEDGVLEWVDLFGSRSELIDNPDKTGINITQKCLKLADSTITKWALTDLDVEIVLPKKDCYFHVMAKSVSSPNLVLRMMPDNITDIYPMDSLVPNDKWQDLVFDVSAKQSAGMEVSQIRFLLDYFGQNLNKSDSVLFLDEMIFSVDSTPRVIPTNIFKVQESSMSLFPSVVDNEINIIGGSLMMVTLIDLSGNSVLYAPVVDNVVDLSSLNFGVYIVQGKDVFGNILLNQKIVKQ